MKHLYSIISLFFILISFSLQSQERVSSPSLTFPEDAETGLAPNVNLDWNAVTGGTLVVLYELQIATNADFSDAVTFPKTEITSGLMSDLLFGKTYYWRVRAFDGDDISDWSEIWSFETAFTIKMKKPSDGSEEYANPNMTWKELTGLLKYQMKIDTSSAWDSPYAKIIDINPDSTNYDLSNLLFGETFHYSMRGIHSLDTSDWAEAKTMITYPFPEPDAPSNSASDQGLEIVFEWDEYEGVTRYYIELSSEENFVTSLNYPSDSNSIKINNLLFNQEYFWRVRAEHSEDISDWSDAFSFTTINNISLLTPSNNETGVPKCPNYTWEEVLGSTSYQIMIDTDVNFSNPLDATITTASYQCQSPLEPKTTYFWKVRGLSGAVYSNWSDTWTFEIEGVDAINDVFSDKSLDIYPNPSNGNFTIDINSIEFASYEVSVSNISGKIIYNSEITCQPGINKMNLNLTEDLSKGIYIVRVSHNNTAANKRLIIK
jgi:hypothetical protein